MGKSCCICHRRRGQEGCGEDVFLFTVPKSIDLYNKWKDAIALTGIVLKQSHYVCHKHFKSDQIRDQVTMCDQFGKVLFQRRYQKVCLIKGAVPSLFETTDLFETCDNSLQADLSVLNKNDVLKTEETIQTTVPSSSNNVDAMVVADETEFINTEVCLTANLSGIANEIAAPSMPINWFKMLHEGSITPQLPHAGWSLSIQKLPKLLVFAELGPSSTDVTQAPYSIKQITLDEQLNIHIFILHKSARTMTMSSDCNSIEQLENIIAQIDKLTVCNGGPPASHYRNVQTRCAYKDMCNKWRHNLCTLTVESGSTCKTCASLDSILRKHLSCKQTSMKPHIPLSPSRKNKLDILRKAKRVQAQAFRRHQRKLYIISQEINELHEKLAQVEESTFEENIKKLNLPDAQVLLIRECASVGKCTRPNGKRYTSEWLLLCMLLRIRSPAAYHFMRNNNILPLPSRSTMHKYLGSINSKSGFEADFFIALKKKFQALPEMTRHGVLLIDEMKVRESISLNVESMTFDGLGNGQKDGQKSSITNDLADYALVFMFSSLGGKFHQPIATFPCKGATPGRILAQLTLQAIIEIEKSGGYVHGIICDGATTNRKMWTELGIQGNIDTVSHFFENPTDENRKIYVFSDTPHLIKCVRNRLQMNKILKINGKFVEWRYYENLYYEDCTNPANLRVCPKLTQNHIKPTNCMKMRVSLATQIFSNSVAVGLQFYQRKNPSKFINCEKTMEFTLLLNGLFDALNRRFPKEGIRKDSKDFETLQNTLNWLDNWERELINGQITRDQFLTKSTTEGLRVTILSTLALTKQLLNRDDFTYVLTAKMNQDRLEQFFGIIRQAGAPNDHPTLPTFLQLYKLLSIYKLVKPPKFGNCTVQDETHKPLVSLADYPMIFKKKTTHISKHLKELQTKLDSIIQTTEWECEDVVRFDHDYASASVVNCIIYYVTGFLCRKLRKRSTCEVCQKAFETVKENNNLSEAELVNMKTRGGLIHGNVFLFSFLSAIEKYFCKNIESEDRAVYESTVCDMIQNYNFSFPCEQHKDEIVSYIMHYYITMRMRQWAKIQSRDILKQSREKKKIAKLMRT